MMIKCRTDVDLILENIDFIKIIPAFCETNRRVSSSYCLPKVNIDKKLNRQFYGDFIVLDTETTGFNYNTGGKIVQLTAIAFKNFEPKRIFTTLLNPQCRIPKGSSDIHNIYDEDVQFSPIFNEVAEQFEEFIRGSILVGHNLIFDLNFLKGEGIDFSKLNCSYLDTLSLARTSSISPENYKLNTLCRYFGLDYFNYHNATEDVIATSQLFICLLNLIFP